eukprot:scaffold1315_cov359-Pinguiococcus_pyrenoidosus.AAC.4
MRQETGRRSFVVAPLGDLPLNVLDAAVCGVLARLLLIVVHIRRGRHLRPRHRCCSADARAHADPQPAPDRSGQRLTLFPRGARTEGRRRTEAEMPSTGIPNTGIPNRGVGRTEEVAAGGRESVERWTLGWTAQRTLATRDLNSNSLSPDEWPLHGRCVAALTQRLKWSKLIGEGCNVEGRCPGSYRMQYRGQGFDVHSYERISASRNPAGGKTELYGILGGAVVTKDSLWSSCHWLAVVDAPIAPVLWHPLGVLQRSASPASQRPSLAACAYSGNTASSVNQFELLPRRRKVQFCCPTARQRLQRGA